MKIWTGKRYIEMEFTLYERLTFVSTAIKHQDREILENYGYYLELGRSVKTDGYVECIRMMINETEIATKFNREEIDSYFYVLAFKHPNQEEVDILRFFFLGIK